MDPLHTITNEILSRLDKLPRWTTEPQIRANKAFLDLYGQLDTPHQLQVDAYIRDNFGSQKRMNL